MNAIAATQDDPSCFWNGISIEIVCTTSNEIAPKQEAGNAKELPPNYRHLASWLPRRIFVAEDIREKRADFQILSFRLFALDRLDVARYEGSLQTVERHRRG